MNTSSHIELEKEFSGQLKIHMNVGQEVLVTTVDKVRICLSDHRECLTQQREWVTPLSLFVAIVTTLIAAEFRDFLLKQAVWQALYVLAAIVTFLWCAMAGLRAWQTRAKASMETIVARLKAESQ